MVADASKASNASSCPTLKTGTDGWKMNSTEGKALATCLYDACCDTGPEPKAGSMFQFGMVMFLGILSYWLK